LSISNESEPRNFDVVIIGAGAAGLMCAMTAGQRGRSVLVIEHANKVGKKILMSGGGRCNFTNLDIQPINYLSQNSHFCKSALARYSQWDFIDLVEKHEVAYHEKKHGQLFCINKAKDILNLLLAECAAVGVTIETHMSVTEIECQAGDYHMQTSKYSAVAESLVIATGALSIPKMGATGFGYEIAEQFNLNVLPTSAGLVPFVLTEKYQQQFQHLSGVSVHTQVICNGQSFTEDSLFTHRGLSGPAMLQISSYWKQGDELVINFLPKVNLTEELIAARSRGDKQQVKNYFSMRLPKQFIETFIEIYFPELRDKRIADLSNTELEHLVEILTQWKIKPSSTEGYRTAEVTLGGVDTQEISSKTFEANKQKNLYFIGEVLDVTGWLGGFAVCLI